MTEDTDDVRLVWVDLEMTGLDPVEDFILEVGFRITNWDGSDEVARFDSLVFNHGWEERLRLGDNRPAFEIHTANGLIAELRDLDGSGQALDAREVESALVGWLDEYDIPRGQPLFGSSNSLDRYFLLRQMPQVAQWFTYRVGDISAVREFMRVTSPDLFKRFEEQFSEKVSSHRPQPDIDDSIELYQWLIDNYLAN